MGEFKFYFTVFVQIKFFLEIFFVVFSLFFGVLDNARLQIFALDFFLTLNGFSALFAPFY